MHFITSVHFILLKSFVCVLGLSLSNCQAHSYEGAAVMSGKYSGVEIRLRQLEPRALFVLCSSHSLNFAVVDACKNSYIRNIFGLYSLLTFFNGAKRQAVLEHCKQNSNISSSSKQRRLQSLSDIRWSSRISALESFQCLKTGVWKR